jgi:hypothetical protein
MTVRLETCDRRNVGSNGEPMWRPVPFRQGPPATVDSALTYLKLNYNELATSSLVEFQIIDADGKIMDDATIRLRIGK